MRDPMHRVYVIWGLIVGLPLLGIAVVVAVYYSFFAASPR